MKKFEYKIIYKNANKEISELELNELGLIGWELTSIISKSNGYFITYYFKREKL